MFSVSEIYSTETNAVLMTVLKVKHLVYLKTSRINLTETETKNGLQYQHRVRRQLIPCYESDCSGRTGGGGRSPEEASSKRQTSILPPANSNHGQTIHLYK